MDALMVTRGKVHEYLGMKVDCRTTGLVNFSQYNGIKNLLKSLPGCIKGLKNTATPYNLSKTDDESCPLYTIKKEQYHTTTAKQLRFSQIFRPEKEMTTGVPCNRVKKIKPSMTGRSWHIRCRTSGKNMYSINYWNIRQR